MLIVWRCGDARLVRDPRLSSPWKNAAGVFLRRRVSIVRSGSEWNWGIEIYVPGISKQVGIEYVARRLGVKQEETMAVGDHLNDIEMLRWAGVGVAMGNALPEVCAAADYVTSSFQKDGVARAIERFVLQSSS